MVFIMGVMKPTSRHQGRVTIYLFVFSSHSVDRSEAVSSPPMGIGNLKPHCRATQMQAMRSATAAEQFRSGTRRVIPFCSPILLRDLSAMS